MQYACTVVNARRRYSAQTVFAAAKNHAARCRADREECGGARTATPDETADQLISNAFVYWRNQMPYAAAIQRTMQQMLLSKFRVEAALGMSYDETNLSLWCSDRCADRQSSAPTAHSKRGRKGYETFVSDDTLEEIRVLIHDHFYKRGYPPTIDTILTMLKDELTEEAFKFKNRKTLRKVGRRDVRKNLRINIDTRAAEVFFRADQTYGHTSGIGPASRQLAAYVLHSGGGGGGGGPAGRRSRRDLA